MNDLQKLLIDRLQSGHPLLRHKKMDEWFIDTEPVPMEAITFLIPYIEKYHNGHVFLFYRGNKKMKELCTTT